MVAAAAWNKVAPARLLLAGLAAAGAGVVGRLSNRAGCSGGGHCEVDFLLGPRRCGDASFGVGVRTWSLFEGAKMEGDGRPGWCSWLDGVGSAGFLRGRPDPELVELGARRRPMWLNWLHPSRWRWCFLRLTKLSGKGLCLLHVDAVMMMLLSAAASCGVLLGHLHLGWKKEVSWSSVLLMYLLLYLLCILYFI